MPEYLITDPSNHILESVKSVLSSAVVETEDGPRVVATIRTTSATVTVVLDRFEAEAWVAQLGKDAARLTAEDPG